MELTKFKRANLIVYLYEYNVICISRLINKILEKRILLNLLPKKINYFIDLKYVGST